MFYDFALMWQSGRDLLNGHYTGHYPLPATLGFAALARLEYWQACFVIMLLSLACLVYATKRQAPLWLFYAPVFMTLGIGQVNLVYLALARSNNPLALALLTTKPQLFVFELHRLWRNKRLALQVCAWCCALYGACFAIRPTWLSEWLAILPIARDGGATMAQSVPMIAAALCLWALGGFRWRALWALLNPHCLHVSDMTQFAGGSLLRIVASWAAFAAWWKLDAQWCAGLVSLL